MSRLTEDSWIVNSASAFSLWPYTSHSLLENSTGDKYYDKNSFDLIGFLKESWGPRGIQGPHLWELLC